MSTTPYMYSDTQFEELEEFVGEKFGSHYDYVVHEITSEYVHTDTFIIKKHTGEKQFITCGMGARKMNTPLTLNNFKRCELVMMASTGFAVTCKEAMTLVAELVRISEVTFREDSWQSSGLTIDASREFKETFGFSHFAFVRLPHSVKLSGIDEHINFLLAVPIYEEEHKWTARYYPFAFLDKLQEKYNGKELYVDLKREVFIPDALDEDEFYDYSTRTILGIDKPTRLKVYEYIEEQKKKGNKVSYQMAAKWLAENQ